jgi:NADH-quinone oxidoreductase subunit G
MEEKRSVKEKTFGPLIKAMMTRCIHCTRCIRFSSEIAGVPEMGSTGRGEHMEVGTYIEKALTSELSGNMIDLCPVGALTSNPYSFDTRPWELKKTESVDVMDAVGSAIRVDTKGGEVMRVLPRLNEDVNEEWVSDKTRFACDGLKKQRLDSPYVRHDGKLQKASWDEAFSAISQKVKGIDGSMFASIIGDLSCAESMTVLKDLTTSIGSTKIDCRQDGTKLNIKSRAGYVFNTTIAGIEESDACLIIGANTRTEAPIINARLRKRYLMGRFKVGMIGQNVDLTFDYENLGSGTDSLIEIADGKHKFSKVLQKAKKPMMILGQGALSRSDGAAVLATARAIAEKYDMIQKDWNGFNVLHTAAARVGGLDLGLVCDGGVASILEECGAGKINVVYLLGADEIDMEKLGKSFVIYQGHHGDAGAHRADVILPGAAYTEKNATFVNTEGRVQKTQLAVFPVGEAREDWTIIRALSDVLGHKLPYDTISEVRSRMVQINKVFGGDDQATGGAWGKFGSMGELESTDFVSPISNFHMTDPISRASKTMAQCTEALFEDKKVDAITYG